ncbi:hypothetical protein VTP01DRAFT_2379 [Rhizomucor pusillus]|uniref:uncharacterized protein n=1 Tax=Rhizomucor pusillus TaxID=4840 RepID=UPI003742A577
MSVRKGHVSTAKAATVGINPATDAIAPCLREINPILGHRERVAYEITKSKTSMNVATKGDLFSAFAEIERKYESYIIHANIVPHHHAHSAYDENFRQSFENSYQTRKRNVILQAIMNGLMEKYFEGYFKALFTALASI